MAKKDDKPDALDIVSRAVNAIDGEGKDIVVIKPELIEPLINRKIEAISIEIVLLQGCLSTFNKSHEIITKKPHLEVLFVKHKYSKYRAAENWIAGCCSCNDEKGIIKGEIPCHKVKSIEIKGPLKEGRTFTSEYSWRAQHEGDINGLRGALDRYNLYTYSSEETQFPTCSLELNLYIVNFGEVLCGGRCKYTDIRKYLTGTENTSDQVAARAQEVLKLKIEERQKLEELHLRLITSVVDRIND